MSKQTTTETDKQTEPAAVAIDTNVIITKKTRIGKSIFLPGARISVTKKLAQELEDANKAEIVY